MPCWGNPMVSFRISTTVFKNHPEGGQLPVAPLPRLSTAAPRGTRAAAASSCPAATRAPGLPPRSALSRSGGTRVMCWARCNGCSRPAGPGGGRKTRQMRSYFLEIIDMWDGGAQPTCFECFRMLSACAEADRQKTIILESIGSHISQRDEGEAQRRVGSVLGCSPCRGHGFHTSHAFLILAR